jgi:hypothetical protein
VYPLGNPFADDIVLTNQERYDIIDIKKMLVYTLTYGHATTEYKWILKIKINKNKNIKIDNF